MEVRLLHSNHLLIDAQTWFVYKFHLFSPTFTSLSLLLTFLSLPRSPESIMDQETHPSTMELPIRSRAAGPVSEDAAPTSAGKVISLPPLY